jgi:hypothetical protein
LQKYLRDEAIIAIPEVFFPFGTYPGEAASFTSSPHDSFKNGSIMSQILARSGAGDLFLRFSNREMQATAA